MQQIDPNWDQPDDLEAAKQIEHFLPRVPLHVRHAEAFQQHRAGKIGLAAALKQPADEELACGADLLLVATYHRKVPLHIYSSCKHAINMHPSLLPKYPGRDPFKAVIENEEKETGITAHRLMEVMDTGDICGQWILPIMPDETNATLRERLAYLAARATIELVQTIRTGNLSYRPQSMI